MKLKDYKWDVSFKNTVRGSIKLGDVTIILLDDDKVTPRIEGYKNLLAVDKLDNVVWVADLPEGSMFSSYWTIKIDNNGLFALCGSFLCEIDIKTGKVLNAKFVK
jgi:hypothetical protein